MPPTIDAVLDRPALLAAARRVTAAVDVAKAGRAKPVLGCLRLAVPAPADGPPTLTGTDQAGWAAADLPATDPPTPGVCLLPADKLASILSECPGPDVRVTATDDGVTLRVAGARFELPLHPAAEFPALADPPEAAGSLAVEAGPLTAAVRRAAACASPDEGRWATAAVCWEVSEAGGLTLVGTDTKVLAACPVPAAAAADAAPRPGMYLVPVRAARAVADAAAKLPPPADGQPAPTVGVRLWHGGAEFRLPGLTAYTTLVEGRYPPFRDVLRLVAPQRTIPVCPKALRAWVRQAKITTAVDSRRVTLAFAPGRVEVTAEGAGAGAATVGGDLPGYAGEGVVEAFDPDYLLKFLDETQGQPSVGLGVPAKPKAGGPAVGWTCDGGDGFVFLVVPLTG